MVNRVFGSVWLAASMLAAALGVAHAQMSSFTMPPDAATAAPSGEPAVAPKPKPKPVPTVTVTVTNASTSTATEVVLSSGAMTAKLARPLAPNDKISVRLPKLKGCMVTLAAVFEGEGKVDAGEFNVCKDKSIRFTD